MMRAVLAAVSDIHAVALQVRLARVMRREDAARLRMARALIGDDHPLAGPVDYFLGVCSMDDHAAMTQALRLRDCVLASMRGQADARTY